MRIMGTPCDSSSAAARLRIWRCRRRSTLCLAVSPSAPQFQVRLWFSPSLQMKPPHQRPQAEVQNILTQLQWIASATL